MLTVSLFLCGALAAAAPAPPTTRPNEPAGAATGPRDLLGRPLAFGKPTQGATAAIHVGRTNLAFGQPFRFSLYIRNPSVNGPYANLHHTVNSLIPRNLSLTLTGKDGKEAPFTLVGFGYHSSLGGTHAQFRLDPKDSSALGRHWKPGTYRLVARIGFPEDTRPGTYKDQIVTRMLTISFASPGEAPAETESEKEARARVKKRIRDLGDPSEEVRKEAEKSLLGETEPVVLLDLAAALAAARPDVKDRLKKVLSVRRGNLDQALMGGNELALGDVLLWLGALSDRDAETIHEHLAGKDAWPLDLWHTMRARYGPITVPQGRPLTRGEKANLVAALGDRTPARRIQALRGIPLTTDADIRAAAGELLLDPFHYVPRMMPCIPVPVHPIANEASEVIARIGPDAVPGVIGAVRKRLGEAEKHWMVLYRAFEVLARFAPDETARKFFEELTDSTNQMVRGTAVHHLGAWGAKSVPFMRKLLANPKEQAELRNKALAFLSQHGTREIDGPILVKLLAEGPAGLYPATAQALGQLKYVQALPQLTKLVKDTRAEWLARIRGIQAITSLAERKEWEALLLYLTDPARGGNVRADALAMLGGHRVKAALPILLAALGDEDSWARELANRGLCGFAGLPSGVGYDPQKPKPELWKEYFRKNPVK